MFYKIRNSTCLVKNLKHRYSYTQPFSLTAQVGRTR